MKYEGVTKVIRSVAEGGGVEKYVIIRPLFYVKYDNYIFMYSKFSFWDFI